MLETDLKGLLSRRDQRVGPYTPLFEAIINSIQSIADAENDNGEILIQILRSSQTSADESIIPEVIGFCIKDNGQGFNEGNLSSFSKLYSTKKIEIGGKGFGRITFLKVFSQVEVKSVFETPEGGKMQRNFIFSTTYNGISRPQEEMLSNDAEVSTTVTLTQLKRNKSYDKNAEVIARKIVEHFLLLFSDTPKYFPRIVIRCPLQGDIILNDYLSKGVDILKDFEETYTVGEGDIAQDFTLKVFKVFFSAKQSEIALCAHHREVISSSVASFVPEFGKAFTEKRGENDVEGRFILKAYVQGAYLDDHVDDFRNGFEFPKDDGTLFSGVSVTQIQSVTASILKENYANLIAERIAKKNERVDRFIDQEEPWYKPYRNKLDFSKISASITDKDLSIELYKIKSDTYLETKQRAADYLAKFERSKDAQADVNALVETIHEMQQSDLIQYVAHRRIIIDLLEHALKKDEHGKYALEDSIHGIIFPTKTDSEREESVLQNLWLIDEKLNFSEYVTSDLPINGGLSDRGDVVVFNNKIAFREGDKKTNPITIFEFKRPDRDDFLAPKEEDPADQIMRYVAQFKEGDYYSPDGRIIEVDSNTPVYAYIICTFTQKVKSWLKLKNFTAMPDDEGYYYWHNELKISFQVLSWDKILRDSKLRNKKFFQMLGI